MPIHTAIDKTTEVLRRTLTGEVTVDELIASFEDSLSHPDYRAGMNSLTDLREYGHQSSTADIRKIADFFIGHTEDIRGGMAAIVVSQTVSYGMVRMLQAYLDASPVSVGVFYDLGEAEQWLGIGDGGSTGAR